MVPFLQKPSMLSMQCLRTCTSSVLVQMQAWLVILCLLLTGPLTLCKKESQVKLKKMAFSHEKSRKSHKKNRLFLDFSWLKTIFFDLTWLSFLQSMMDQIWCWEHTHPLGLLAQQAIHFHQIQHQVQLPQLHPLPREPPTTSSDSATTSTSTWTTSSCTASGTTGTPSTSGTSNAASGNPTTTSTTPCTTKAANAWSIMISSYQSANSTSILTLPSS